MTKLVESADRIKIPDKTDGTEKAERTEQI